ncbi:MAG: hypothetical protein EP317_05615 [Bacillota bacterium]|nr:MAG: hypothetical protein EP317_05615 [Bacillota bacterium]
MNISPSIKNIDDYIYQANPSVQPLLKEMRVFIKSLVPEAIEKISYQMPTFYLNGNLVHFAAQKNHLGFYPGGSVIHLFENKLKNFKHSKGAIQFPYDKDIPWDLLKEMITYRREENLNLKK